MRGAEQKGEKSEEKESALFESRSMGALTGYLSGVMVLSVGFVLPEGLNSAPVPAASQFPSYTQESGRVVGTMET